MALRKPQTTDVLRSNSGGAIGPGPPLAYIFFMLWRILAVFAVLSVLPIASADVRKSPKTSAKVQCGTKQAQPAMLNNLPKQVDMSVLKSDPPTDQRGDKAKPFWVSSDRNVWDWTAYIGNLALVVIGICGIVVAGFTLRKIERQTAAIENQAKHMVASERPFLIAYAQGWDVWIWNCGKSPAQLIAFSPFKPIYPKFDQRSNGWPMPQPPQYGQFYDDAFLQLNIGWIGPGERRQIESFDPTLVRLHKEIADKFFMYGAVKYRGLFVGQEKPYETRYCYGLNGEPVDPNASMFIGGSYSYNQNT